MVRMRRHHNNNGRKTVRDDRTANQVKKMAKKILKQGGDMQDNQTKVPPDIIRDQRETTNKVKAADHPGTDRLLADLLNTETHCFEISRAIRNLLDDPPQCIGIDQHGLPDGIMNVVYLAGEIYLIPVRHTSIDHYIQTGDVAHVFCKETAKFENLSILSGGLRPQDRKPLPWSLLCNGCHRQFREIPADTAKCWLEIRERMEAQPC